MPEIDRRQLSAYALLAVVVIALGTRYLRSQAHGASAPQVAVTSAPRDAQVSLDSGGGNASLVHVAGAVRHPGVYRLEPGRRVKDALARAGGATAKGDPNAINLAAKVADGQQVVVPRRTPAGAAAAAAPGGPAPPGAASPPV